MNRNDKAYDPGAPGRANGNLFGMPFSWREAPTVVIAAPWEVTASYGAGTADAPAAVLAASTQLDFEVPGVADAWRLAPGMAPIDRRARAEGVRLRRLATRRIAALEGGARARRAAGPEDLDAINRGCAALNARVRKTAAGLLAEGRGVALLGGDHGAALGLIEALSAARPGFGILQIDAHMDLRRAYEGFLYSHASIMHNALELAGVARLVQVGARDFCAEEVSRARAEGGRVRSFHAAELHARLFDGEPWRALCDEMADALPREVYVSFDVDGLEPWLCPGTGTPVPDRKSVV